MQIVFRIFPNLHPPSFLRTPIPLTWLAESRQVLTGLRQDARAYDMIAAPVRFHGYGHTRQLTAVIPAPFIPVVLFALLPVTVRRREECRQAHGPKYYVVPDEECVATR